MNSKNEIILYQTKELASRIEVRVEDETVWLNRNQIASLFNRDVKTIGKHINNVFTEAELDKDATVANFATVQNQLFGNSEQFKFKWQVHFLHQPLKTVLLKGRLYEK